MKIPWIFLLSLLISLESQALCVRFPDNTFQNFGKTDCEFRLDVALTLLPPQISTDKSYDALLDRLERGENQDKAWSQFIQDFSPQRWGHEELQMLHEVSQTLRRQGRQIEREQRLFQFGHYRDFRLFDFSEFKKLAETPGWEDLQIQVLSLEDEKNEELLRDPRPHHWILASSSLQPLFHWGNLHSALDQLRQNPRTWVEGSCTAPHWQTTFRNSTENIRAFGSGNCEITAKRMAENPQAAKFSELDLPKPLHPSLQKERTHDWWWVALGVVALGAYAMKDKKLVFTRGSF